MLDNCIDNKTNDSVLIEVENDIEKLKETVAVQLEPETIPLMSQSNSEIPVTEKGPLRQIIHNYECLDDFYYIPVNSAENVGPLYANPSAKPYIENDAEMKRNSPLFQIVKYTLINYNIFILMFSDAIK